MCLIVAKQIGVNVPSNRNLVKWFRYHDDGAGIMYSLPNSTDIHIVKGLMTAKSVIEMKDAIKREIRPLKLRLCDINMVFHFRQATEGTVKQSNCHPFPLTSDRKLLSSLDCVTDYGIAHNGIIWDYGAYTNKTWYLNANNKDDVTDTQLFIEQYLVKIGGSNIVNNEGIRDLIAQYTDSRFAILSQQGITLIGEFILEKQSGLLYSNSTYQETYTATTPFQPYAFDYGFGKEDSSYYQTERCDICNQYVSEDLIIDDGELFTCRTCHEAIRASEKVYGGELLSIP